MEEEFFDDLGSFDNCTFLFEQNFQQNSENLKNSTLFLLCKFFLSLKMKFQKITLCGASP